MKITTEGWKSTRLQNMVLLFHIFSSYPFQCWNLTNFSQRHIENPVKYLTRSWNTPLGSDMKFFCFVHCVKSVRIRSFSGPYFPAFGLSTERYSASLRIQSEYVKIWTLFRSSLDFEWMSEAYLRLNQTSVMELFWRK